MGRAARRCAALVVSLLVAAPVLHAAARGGGLDEGRGAPAWASLTSPSWSLSHGDHKAIMLLVDFTDVTHNASNTWTKYDSWANANGSTDRSLRTYLYENSGGNYTVNVTVVGWLNLTQTMSYYVASLSRLAGDAALAANSQVNFSQFDEDGNGQVDNLIVVHAGSDQAASGDGNDIYSETGTATATSVDGVTVRLASIVAEDGSTGTPLGVIIHEYGHLAFDLPDLYDTNFNHAGVGEWDLMAFGGWGGGGGANPNHMSVWTKYYLGWVSPVVPAYDVSTYTIFASSDPSRANPVKLPTNNSNEYFLIEFRYRNTSARFDAYLPASGLVIWHVDDNVLSSNWAGNTVNNAASHKGLDVEEVGTQDMDQSWFNTGSSNDVWVSNATGFTPSSTPNSNMYSNGGNDATGISINNISAVLTSGGPHMTFSIRTGLGDYSVAGQFQNGSQRTLAPGQSANYTILFATASASGDTLNLTLGGDLVGPDAVLNRTSMALPPGGSGLVRLQVTMPTGCASGQAYTTSVRAGSTAAPLEDTIVTALSTCAYSHGLTVAGSLALQVTPGQVVAQNYTLTSTGDGPENVSISLSTNSSSLHVQMASGNLTVPAGGSREIQVDFSVVGTEIAGALLGATLDFSYGDVNATLHAWRNVTVAVGEVTALRLSVGGAQPAQLATDTPYAVDLTVYNDGNHAAAVALSAVAPPGVNVTFSGATPTVAPFGSVVVGANVTATASWPVGTLGQVSFHASTAGIGSPVAASFAFAVGDYHQVSVTGPTAASALPGAPTLLQLAVRNLGNVLENVSVAASYDVGLLAVSFDAGPTTFAAGSNRTIDVIVTLDASVSAGTVVPVTMDFAYGPSGSPLHASFGLNVTALAQGGLWMELNPALDTALEPGRSYTFNLTVHNDVNAVASVTLAIAGPVWLQVSAPAGPLPVAAQSTGVRALTLRTDPSVAAGTVGVLSVLATASVGNASLALSVRQGQTFAVGIDGERFGSGDPGDTVTFDLVAVNGGNGPDNVTIEVTAQAAGWVPSTSPTAMALGASGPTNRTAFLVSVDVPAGAAGNAAVDLVVTVRSQQAGVSATAVLTVVVSPTAGMALQGPAAAVAVDPGQEAAFPLVVANLGNLEATFTITGTSLPAAWSWQAEDDAGIAVPAGESGTTRLLVQVPHGAVAGPLQFTVTVTGPAGAGEASLGVLVNTTYGLQVLAAALPSPARPGDTLTVNVTVHNAGNAVATVQLHAAVSAANITASGVTADVPAFGSATIAVPVILAMGAQAGNYTIFVHVVQQGHPEVASSAQVALEVQAGSNGTGGERSGGGDGNGGTLAFEVVVAVVVLAAAAMVGLLLQRRR